MTTDHHLNPHVLSRAIGIEGGSRADYCDEPAAPGDRFLLTSDGVHGLLRGEPHRADPAAAGSAGRDRAIARRRRAAAGGRDNATALIVDVLEIPAANRADLAAGIASLPIGPLPARATPSTTTSSMPYSRTGR